MWTDFHQEWCSKRENLESSSWERTTSKMAMNCPTEVSLQSIPSHWIQEKPFELWCTSIFRNCIHAIIIHLPVVRWSLTMHSDHRSVLLSTPTLIEVNIVLVRLTMNMWFNSVQLTRKYVHNHNANECSWPICLQSWCSQVLESRLLPLIYQSYLTILSLHLYVSFVFQILSFLH